MTEKLDLRGLSCPQPIFETQKKIWAMKNGHLEILVDDGTSKINVSRTAEKEGWKVEIKEIEDEEYLITISKE